VTNLSVQADAEKATPSCRTAALWQAACCHPNRALQGLQIGSVYLRLWGAGGTETGGSLWREIFKLWLHGKCQTWDVEKLDLHKLG
jgi:hypothetical protein